jgi:hypothetical protein
MLRIPVIHGLIRRRILVNFRADPEVVQKILPGSFKPKTHRGFAIVGICLIRIEKIRPKGIPAQFGISSENAAHRIAVIWEDRDGENTEGVFIPRRDTGSLLNHLAGGRLFPGEHKKANFRVQDDGEHIDFEMRSNDGDLAVLVCGKDSDHLPPGSCFESLDAASQFFKGGCVGYSVTCDPTRLDGLTLKTLDWKVRALEITKVYSSYFSNQAHFPKGSIEFDHTLVMRNLDHEWHQADEMRLKSTTALEN